MRNVKNSKHSEIGVLFLCLHMIFEEKLKNSVVAIAGLGGLGSTVAAALARAGVGKLIIADFDKVELGNLNRQHYFVDQVGKNKSQATKQNLARINPAVKVESHKVRLEPGKIKKLFGQADVVAECFDSAAAKRMLVETVLSDMNMPVVSASGMAGYGNSNTVHTRRVSPRFILVGDETSGIDTNGYLTAARVWLVASHQANAILELLIDGRDIKKLNHEGREEHEEKQKI